MVRAREDGLQLCSDIAGILELDACLQKEPSKYEMIPHVTQLLQGNLHASVGGNMRSENIRLGEHAPLLGQKVFKFIEEIYKFYQDNHNEQKCLYIITMKATIMPFLPFWIGYLCNCVKRL